MSQDWLCAYYEYYITPHIVIQPSVGVFFIRNFNFYERDQQLDAKVAIVNLGNRSELQESTVHGMAPFVGVHLFYRVDTH